MHQFVAIGEFKLELQSGNDNFGSKWAIFFPCYLEIWRMTFKNNRAPPLGYLKLCASLHSHQSIETGARVRKPEIRVKIGNFVPRDLEIGRMTLEINRAHALCYFKLCLSFDSHVTDRTLNFDAWPRKTIGHLCHATTSFVRHFIVICEFWPLTLTSCMGITSVIGNISWNFHHDEITGK